MEDNCSNKLTIALNKNETQRTFNIPSQNYTFDKLDEIFSEAVDFKNQIDKKFEGLPFSCYNFVKEEYDIDYDLDNVIEEAVEAKRLLNRKRWKTERKEVNKQELLEELVDIDKFVIQAVIRLGFSASDFYNMHKEKNKKNIDRQKNNY